MNAKQPQNTIVNVYFGDKEYSRVCALRQRLGTHNGDVINKAITNYVSILGSDVPQHVLRDLTLENVVEQPGEDGREILHVQELEFSQRRYRNLCMLVAVDPFSGDDVTTIRNAVRAYARMLSMELKK